MDAKAQLHGEYNLARWYYKSYVVDNRDVSASHMQHMDYIVCTYAA